MAWHWLDMCSHWGTFCVMTIFHFCSKVIHFHVFPPTAMCIVGDYHFWDVCENDFPFLFLQNAVAYISVILWMCWWSWNGKGIFQQWWKFNNDEMLLNSPCVFATNAATLMRELSVIIPPWKYFKRMIYASPIPYLYGLTLEVFGRERYNEPHY